MPSLRQATMLTRLHYGTILVFFGILSFAKKGGVLPAGFEPTLPGWKPGMIVLTTLREHVDWGITTLSLIGSGFGKIFPATASAYSLGFSGSHEGGYDHFWTAVGTFFSFFHFFIFLKWGRPDLNWSPLVFWRWNCIVPFCRCSGMQSPFPNQRC